MKDGSNQRVSSTPGKHLLKSGFLKILICFLFVDFRDQLQQAYKRCLGPKVQAIAPDNRVWDITLTFVVQHTAQTIPIYCFENDD